AQCRRPRELLLGREGECEVLDGLVAAARDGQGRALVIQGEPGVGKTALLQYAVAESRGLMVATTVGVEGEMDFPFSALQRLCAPLLRCLDRLADPQRVALEVAFGMSSGRTPDRFLVGLAVLSLLSAAAEDQPLLCVVDDAQWLDQGSALAL